MSELKACPFCGFGPVLSPSGDGTGEMIECVNYLCGVSPHCSHYGSVAATKWNSRPLEAEAYQRGRVDGVRESISRTDRYELDAAEKRGAFDALTKVLMFVPLTESQMKRVLEFRQRHEAEPDAAEETKCPDCETTHQRHAKGFLFCAKCKPELKAAEGADGK